MRFLDQNGVCNFTEKNSPKDTNDAFMPWFMSEEMKIKDMNIFLDTGRLWETFAV